MDLFERINAETMKGLLQFCNFTDLTNFARTSKTNRTKIVFNLSIHQRALLDLKRVDLRRGHNNFVWMHHDMNVRCPVPMMFEGVTARTWLLIFEAGTLVSVRSIENLALRQGFISYLERFERNVTVENSDISLTDIFLPNSPGYITGSLRWIAVMRDEFHIDQLRHFLLDYNPRTFRGGEFNNDLHLSEYKDRYDIPVWTTMDEQGIMRNI